MKWKPIEIYCIFYIFNFFEKKMINNSFERWLKNYNTPNLGLSCLCSSIFSVDVERIIYYCFSISGLNKI